MSHNPSGFRRFIHWGPISVFLIIKCVTLTTLYMNSMWWPPNKSFDGFIHQSLFLVLSSLATFNYIMATLTGPGFLLKGWKPKNKKDIKYLQYCNICEGYKAPRSHHCRKCERCVKKMDHHCPWMNNCVGWANHAYFVSFLGFCVLGGMQASVILIASFYRGIYRYWYIYNGYSHLATVHFGVTSLLLCIFSLGMAIGVVIALGMLFYIQMRAIINNRTGIEDWIIEKASYRIQTSTEGDDTFIYPYDLGKRKNFHEVMNWSCAPVGDGIIWPVVAGCDQYTLTREQIAQKSEKRARTKTYKVIRKSTGRYLPLFSQGLRVCMSPPCTNEPRIRLSPDDIVKVTRWQKHWLFGEKYVPETNGNTSLRKNRIRGWFPRRCAVELIEPSSEENHNYKHDKKSK